MIKQDNRPKADTFESRFNSLKALLYEQPKEQHRDNMQENNPAANDRGKAVFISVNGNNNIVSAGKSQYIDRDRRKRTALFSGFIFCTLFF